MKAKIVRLATAALFSVSAVLGLAACSSQDAGTSLEIEGLTGGVAATVDGTEIMEDTVTTYIQSFRIAQALDTEDAWGTYLASVGLEPSSIREQVIDYYTANILVQAGAEEYNIELTDEEVDEQIAKMRANFESDEAWQAALDQAGTTESFYRENVREAMLESRLQEKLAESVEPISDDELLDYVQMYIDYFNGAKRSSHILFNEEDKETAEKVLEQLKNGELDFAEAAKEYSQDPGSAENGGDISWDMLTTIQGSGLVEEYTNALAELDKGEMTQELVQSQYGYHIIMVTDVYTMPEDGVTSLDQAPEELVEYLRSMMNSSKESSVLNDWIEEQREAADIEINEMPEAVPYNLDITKYQTEEDEELDAESSGLEVDVEAEDWESSEEDVVVDEDIESSVAESSSSEEEVLDTQSSEAESSSSEADAESAEEDLSSQPAEISSEAETRSE